MAAGHMAHKSDLTMDNTIRQRLETFVSNCEHQGGFAMWDDIEKLESILALMKRGKSLDDQFEFITEENGKDKE